MTWSMKDAGSQHGKTFLITGSNTGIGFATAKLLAGNGAQVILACRNREKGEQSLARLKAQVPSAQATLLQLDLASLTSVRQAAETINSQASRLDALINNAGVMMPPFGRTADGFETQFGTNVLGHFAFTGLLLPLLERTPQARVVWLSSIAHWVGRINFEDLNAEKGYRTWRAYAQSKLADLMLAYEMQRRLQRAGSTAMSLGAHPGGTNSDLGRHRTILKFVSPFAQSVEAGAMPSLRAAVDAAARGGEYYGPAGIGTFKGPAERQRSSQRSHDEAVAARLWQACEALTGVRYLD